MLETSEDILSIVKAVCLVGVSAMIIWATYYFAMILKQVYEIIKETRERFQKIDSAIKAFKEKIERGSSYAALIKDGMKMVVDIGKKAMSKEKKTGKKK